MAFQLCAYLNVVLDLKKWVTTKFARDSPKKLSISSKYILKFKAFYEVWPHKE